MSTEEDTELRDLLQQTLENNGTLATIRAHLRASVFMAFHEDEKIQRKPALLNHKVCKYLEKPEGQMIFAIVHEFLEYFGMDYTQSVFKAESNLDMKTTGRSNLLAKLQLKDNDTGPILQQLLRQNGLELAVNQKETTVDLQKTPLLNKTYEVLNNLKESKESTPRSLEEKNDTYDDTSSIAEDSIPTSIKENSSSIDSQLPLSISLQDQQNKPLKLKVEQAMSAKASRSISALSEINLAGNKSPRGGDLVLPTFYNSNQAFDDGLDNYEEDFMVSSDTNKD